VTAAAAARSEPLRRAGVAAAALAAFAILFTAGSSLGVWPEPAVGAFDAWDLWAGTAVGVLWLVYLLYGERVEN
jgi:hypothetical protein